MKYELIDELPQDVQREVRIELMKQSLLGKNSFPYQYIGSGWLSRKKDGTILCKQNGFRKAEVEHGKANT